MAKDHYVMSSYLARFVHPTSDKKILFPYQVGLGLIPWKRNGCGPKGLGWAKDFYTAVSPSGQIDRNIDEYLREVESRYFASGKGNVSALSRCCVDSQFFPHTVEQRKEIAFCTAFTHVRAPVQIHSAAMLLQLHTNIDVLNSITIDAQYVRQYMEYADISSESEATKRLHDFKDRFLRGEYKASVGTNNERQLGFEALQMLETMQENIYRMVWTILEADPKHFFLTSDNPVVVYDPSMPSKRFNGVVQSESIEIWFPISCRFGFLMKWRTGKTASTRRVLGHSETRSLNRRIIRWCYKHVYSPLACDWIDEYVKVKSFRPLVDRFSSLHELAQSTGTNTVEVLWALEHGEEADVLADVKMH